MTSNIFITDSAILIVVIFGAKNLVMQKHRKAIEQEKVYAMSD